MQTADIVIIGSGIVGSSIAYHLINAGCSDVMLLEREAYLGKGSTGKSMGGVRAQFSSELNIRLSMYSIEFFRNFEEVVGHPSGFRPQGYLFVATSQKHLEYLRATYELQVSLGLGTVSRLEAREILRMVPQLRGEDILGGNFCSTDGFVDPYSVMNGFNTRAVEGGARLLRGAEVTRIVVEHGAMAGVETSAGFIASRTVVNAAGPWAGLVAKLAGADLPVEPLRRMLVPTEPTELIAHTAPMVVDMTSGFHFRPEGPGLLLAWNDPEETPGFKTSFDPAFIEKILTRAIERVPEMESVPVNPRRAWAGLYEMTPDHYPVLGPDPNVRGLYYANGFSGHGVMHSPATGRIVADLILRGCSDLIDASLLSVTRFAEGRLLSELAVL